jgi:3-phenylpropionate/trans-cinnamate dioxygenase ferredoxin reductase subunit
VKVRVNRATCRGYGNCVLAAADVFELDDDGLVVLLEDDVDAERAKSVERAIYDCPTDSIALERSPGDEAR